MCILKCIFLVVLLDQLIDCFGRVFRTSSETFQSQCFGLLFSSSGRSFLEHVSTRKTLVVFCSQGQIQYTFSNPTSELLCIYIVHRRKWQLYAQIYYVFSSNNDEFCIWINLNPQHPAGIDCFGANKLAWQIPVSYTHLRAHETPEHRGWRGVR